MQVTGNNIQNNKKSIRFSTGGLSLYIGREKKEFSFDKPDEDFHKSMAICLCENSISSSDLESIDIYIDNPYYNLIPQEIGNKDICISAFKLSYPDICIDHLIMAEEIEKLNIISAFGIHNGLYEFIKTHFPIHNIHHYCINGVIKSLEHSRFNSSKEVWGILSDNLLTINLVDNGKLLLSNSFKINKPTDTLYYIGSVYEQYNLPIKTTELIFCGDDSHYDVLKRHISNSNIITDICEL